MTRRGRLVACAVVAAALLSVTAASAEPTTTFAPLKAPPPPSTTTIPANDPRHKLVGAWQLQTIGKRAGVPLTNVTQGYLLVEEFLGGVAGSLGHGWQGCGEVAGLFGRVGRTIRYTEHFERVAIGCRVRVPALAWLARDLDGGVRFDVGRDVLVLTARSGRTWRFARCTPDGRSPGTCRREAA